jgi:hypothetical protein
VVQQGPPQASREAKLGGQVLVVEQGVEQAHALEFGDAPSVYICPLVERLAGAERARKAEVLAREVVVIADLRMALAEARRPFWRRWLSG